MDPMRCPYGRCTGPAWESPMFFISYGTCTWPVWDLQRCLTAPLQTHKGIDTNRICKIPIQHLMWLYRRPLQSLHRLFTGCVRSVSELRLLQTVRQIPRPISLGIWPPVLHTPLCIVTTNPSRTGLNPVMETTIDSDHGLLHVCHQAMVWTNAGLLSDSWEQISVDLNQHSIIFIQENTFENVV